VDKQDCIYSEYKTKAIHIVKTVENGTNLIVKYVCNVTEKNNYNNRRNNPCYPAGNIKNHNIKNIKSFVFLLNSSY
jgi:hypothetical protein